jgi:hypothetical protein
LRKWYIIPDHTSVITFAGPYSMSGMFNVYSDTNRFKIQVVDKEEHEVRNDTVVGQTLTKLRSWR